MTSAHPDRGVRRGGLRRMQTRMTVLITSLAAFAASWVIVARADQTQFGAEGAAPETQSAAALPGAPVQSLDASAPAAPLDERLASAGTRTTQATQVTQAAPTGAAGSAAPSATATAVRTPVALAPTLAPAPAAPTRSAVIRRSRAS